MYLIAPGPRLGNLKKKHHKLLALGKSTYSDDEEEEIIYFPIKRWFFNPNEDILMPEDMTEGLLNNDFVYNKVYDQAWQLLNETLQASNSPHPSNAMSSDTNLFSEQFLEHCSTFVKM